MKITYLKKRIIKSFSIAAGLLALAACFFYYRVSQDAKSKKLINNIKSQTSEIESEIESLTSKMQEVKKYKEIWVSISENKKSVIGIKIDNINLKIEQLSPKYNISQANIKVSFPENLKDGVFNISSSDLVSSVVNLTFNSITDTDALMFISDLFQSLPGYIVINRLSISKTRNYTNEDLLKISSGTATGAIQCNLDFFWYVYKPKSIIDSPTQENTSNAE
jgi:hypothetical protein